jgi:hypothetical protein
METVDLTGLEIYDIDGIEKIRLVGEYSLEDLTSKMTEEWIEFAECQADCARSDYCKFACGESEEIRCGFAISALSNFVKATFQIFSKLNTEDKQEYLDGTFYLIKYIFETEIKLGIFIYDGFNIFHGKYAPFAFTSLVNQREILDSIGKHFKSLPELNLGKGVLFVEGKTEFTFLSEMRKTNLLWFRNLLVKSYGGKDNVRPRRIEMLIKDHREFGYEIFISGDGDGKKENRFQELIKKKLVDSKNTFLFAFDFESAVPDDVFFNALIKNKVLEKVSLAEYINKVSSSPFGNDEESVKDFISREFGINIENYKIQLARSIAAYYSDVNTVWWKNDNFMKTDFGRFLQFIIKIPKY